MPPSTDCSAATSCGGCRSYAGAVGDGRSKSSATATGSSIHSRRTRAHAPARSRGLVGEAPERCTPDSNVCSGRSYPGAPTVRAVTGPKKTLGSADGPVQHRCGRASAQLVDKSVDTAVSTCGDSGGRRDAAPRIPPLTCTETTHRVWTGEICEKSGCRRPACRVPGRSRPSGHTSTRSEEHTSELQSRQYLVCRLLLEKNKHIVYSLHPNRLKCSVYLTL